MTDINQDRQDEICIAFYDNGTVVEIPADEQNFEGMVLAVMAGPGEISRIIAFSPDCKTIPHDITKQIAWAVYYRIMDSEVEYDDDTWIPDLVDCDELRAELRENASFDPVREWGVRTIDSSGRGV